MAKKRRMGRGLNALMGGATRAPAADDSAKPTVTAIDPASSKPSSVESSPADATSSDSFAAPSEKKAEHASNKPADRKLTEDKPAISQPTAFAESASVESASAESALATNASKSDPSEPSSNQLTSSQPGENVNGTDSHPSDKLRMLGVDQITRGIYQPRRYFDPELLQELADSITAQGLIQPILVRAYAGKYELIAGERRWRAAQLAGISDIPAIVRDMDDQSVAAVSLIENIQREDLNPLEEATALERLCAEFTMTHQQVAEAVGRSRAAVTNLMRLLDLHDEVKGMVDEGKLDMGHARALLGAPQAEQPVIARRVVQQGLTVRAVEKLVKDMREGKATANTEPAKTDPNIEALGLRLGKLLGASVNINHKQTGSGKLEIKYSSVDELEGILKHIK